MDDQNNQVAPLNIDHFPPRVSPGFKIVCDEWVICRLKYGFANALSSTPSSALKVAAPFAAPGIPPCPFASKSHAPANFVISSETMCGDISIVAEHDKYHGQKARRSAIAPVCSFVC
jgi:hypothetical protein